MNPTTEAVLGFVLDCYNNSSISTNSPERQVLTQMCCDTNNMGLGMSLNTWMFDSQYKTIQDLTDAVADSLVHGWDELLMSANQFMQNDDGCTQWEEHFTTIMNIDTNQIEWRILAEALWGDDIRKYIQENHMKQVILIGRHTSGVEYHEHGFNVVEQRNINWATESDEAVIAQWDELCSEAWDKELSILLQNIPAPLAIALVQNEWDVSVYITIQVMGDRPADVKKSFRMTAYDMPTAIEMVNFANARTRINWDGQSPEIELVTDPITPFKMQRIAQLF